MYRSGAAWELFGDLGVTPSGATPDVRGAIAVDGDRVGPLPVGVMTLLRSPIIAGSRTRFGRFFAGLGKIDPVSFGNVTGEAAIAQLVGGGQGAKLLESLFRLAAYSNDPEHASADALLLQLKDGNDTPVLYLDGGWQNLVDSVLAVAISRGVEIRYDTKVDAVTEHGDGVEVRAGDTLLGARTAVIAGLNPAGVAGLLPSVPSVVEGWVQAARPATAATLDVGLPEPWGSGPDFALGLDKPLHLSVHAPVARLAPEGACLVQVARYQHPDEEVDFDRDRAECETLLDVVRPGWRDVADHVGFNRRLVAAQDQPQASRGGMAGRPGVALPDHHRVFVAGDWVGPEGVLVDDGRRPLGTADCSP